MRKSIIAVAAAVSMIGAGSAAVAQSAAALSVRPLAVPSDARAGVDLQDANGIRGGFILPTLGILAIIAIIYFVTKGGDDPASP